MVLCFAYSPRGYELAGRSILVKRLAGAARVPLSDVREARRATPDDFRGCIRLGGSGGLFGYYGLFSTAKLGKSTWYVTNRSNSVVLIAGAKTVLLSPDDPNGFLDTIRTYAPVATSSAPFSPERSSQAGRSFGAIGKVLAFTVGLAGMGLGILAFNYSPGVPSYTLTHDRLTIHDRLYPLTLRADAVDIANIRIVDLATDPDWKPTVRTNGFANSHYRSGWFRVASGQKVRLYLADNPRVVLLPPNGDGAPVLYQAADPEKFVDEIRAAWSASAQSSAKAGK